MIYKTDNGKLTIALEGEIDACNAKATGEEVRAIVDVHTDMPIVFDATNLHYISSAGLRILLGVQKRKAPEKVTVQNVTRGIYEILDETGFTDLMNVKKRVREIQLEGAKVIGEGQSSTVYRMDRETIVKLYKPGVPLAKIEQEKAFAKKAFVAGIPTVISYDLVKCGDNYGAVFEMVDHADTVGHTLTAHPDQFDSIMKKFVEAYQLIHHTDIKDMGGFVSLKDTWRRWADGMQANGSFLPAEADMLRRMIDAIPERPTMVHCDFHAGNVMYQRDQIVVIDMADIGYGHPIFDLAGGAFHARYSHFPTRQKVHGMSQEGMLHFWDTLLRLYFKTDDEQRLQQIREMTSAFGLLRGALFPMKHVQIKPEVRDYHVAETRQHLFPHIDWAMNQVKRLDEFFEH